MPQFHKICNGQLKSGTEKERFIILNANLKLNNDIQIKNNIMRTHLIIYP